jgi:hypothetical protein
MHYVLSKRRQVFTLRHYSYLRGDLRVYISRSQWPRGVRRRSAVARLLRLWFRIPMAAWMSVCCECCVLSGRGLCDELITRPEYHYRLWCVVVCDQQTSWMRRPWPALGRSATETNKQTNKFIILICDGRKNAAEHYPEWTHDEGTRFWNNISAAKGISVHWKFKTGYVFVLSYYHHTYTYI